MKEARNRANQDLVEIGDYGVASIQLRRLIRNFRDLPVHVLLTALAKQDIEPKVGNVMKPALSGKLADELPGIVDVVGYMTQADIPDGKDAEGKAIFKSVYAMILKNYPAIRAKIRVPRNLVDTVPDALVDPTVTSLLDALYYSTEVDPKELGNEVSV